MPLDVLVDMLLSMGTGDPSKLRACLKQLWDFILHLELAEDDEKKLFLMVRGNFPRFLGRLTICLQMQNMDSACKDMPLEYAKKLSLPVEGDECEPKCVAATRHSREKEEIDQLIKPTIETRMSGPGKMVSFPFNHLVIWGRPRGFSSSLENTDLRSPESRDCNQAFK